MIDILLTKEHGVEKMEESLVTAIITTYKRPVELLKRAVLSVINQTYQNWELYVINDCPEDNELTSDINLMIQEIEDKRVNYVCMEKNSGACAARNKGIELSKGEYIALLDDDDEWCPDKIALQVEAFTSDRIGLIYSPFYNITDLNSKPQIIARSTASGNLFESMLYKNIAGGCSMTMFSRKAVNDCGMFDERLLSSQDYDFYLRISEKYEFAFVAKPLVNRYLLDESITKNPEKQKLGWELFTKKHQNLYMEHRDAYSYRINRRVSELIENGDFSQALKYYRKALKIKPISKHNILEPLKGLGKFLGYKNMKDSQIQ